MKRILLVASISLVVVATIPSVAHAHPAYKDSSPQWDASVSSPPSEVWVEFTERIEGGSVTIYDPCGERADHGDDEMNLTKDRLTTGAHGDKAGTYVVQWAVAGADSHETRGEFTFTSTGGADCPGAAEPDPEERQPREREAQRPRDEDARTTTTIDDDGGMSGTRSDEERTSTERGPDARAERAEDRREGQLEETARGPDDLPERTSARSIWDGIPIGDFLIALAVAALIGAAGGRIYAGIVGPRR